MLDRKYISAIKLIKEIPKNSYLASIPAIRYLSEIEELSFDSNVTFFVGDNGVGKSTLLESIAIASKLNPEGGDNNILFKTNDTHSELHRLITTVKENYPRDKFFLRAESMYNFATYADEVGSSLYSDLHKCSHGESFLNVFETLSGNGLYILDEPEAALSPMKLLNLMCSIKKLVDKDSQFIIATHSPILMTFPGAQILNFNESGIENIHYKDTEHYQITKLFLDCPDRMLKSMLSEYDV